MLIAAPSLFSKCNLLICLKFNRISVTVRVYRCAETKCLRINSVYCDLHKSKALLQLFPTHYLAGLV